ncbi:MAG: AMP-binding protein [Candidatus Saccharibacteria bacterium]|nr:AMP-binding protein [Candidatus Saccharibacteria bacterium]
MKKIANEEYEYYDVPKLADLWELVCLRRTSKQTAFTWREDGKLCRKSFADFYEEVKLLSSYFYANYRGKNIAVIGEDSYVWALMAISIVVSGNICVALDKDSDADILRKQLRQADVRAVYYSLNYCEKMGEIFRESYPFEDLGNYLKIGRKIHFKIDQDVDKDAMIFFTSGTTGYSKAVVLSQKNIVADIYGAASLFMPDKRAASFLPYHHAFGFVTSLLMPYYYGCNVFISGSLKHLMDDFKDGKPDTIFAVPMVVETMYRQIWRTARRQKREKKLSTAIKISDMMRKIGIDWRKKFFKSILDEFGGNVDYIICGGAPLDVKYVEWFRSIGIEVLVGYGITECSPVVAVNRNHYKHDGSVGQICRDINVKIIDEEIVVSGDIVMKGYYKDRRATEEVLHNGNFYTGDLGRIDGDGFLYVTGRRKNLIILSNGENVSPEEIESELARDVGIAEVIAYEDGNRIVVSIVPDKGYLGDQDYFDELVGEYNKGKPKNRQIAFVRLREDEFPRNNNGKVLRDKLIKEEKDGKGSF